MSRQPRRILGLTLDGGLPIYEPNATASSLTYAAAGGGKTTCVAVPALMCMLADTSRAQVFNDVKNGEISAQIAGLCIKHGRKFGVIDDSYTLGRDYPYRISVNPFGNVVTAWEQNNPDLVFEIENTSHTFIDEPKNDAKNKFFRDGPRMFFEFGLLELLIHNSTLATPGGLAAFLGDPGMLSSAIDIAAEEGNPLIRSRACQLQELRDNDPDHYSQHSLAVLDSLRTFQIGSPLHEVGRDQDISHFELLRDNWVVGIVQNQRNAARLGAYYAQHFLSFTSAQLSGLCGRADYILDEAANSPVRDKISKVTVERAYGGRTHYIAQSRTDLQNQYGEKETATLEENCTVKQWLKFSNFEEAERVSRAMGEIDNVNNNLSFNSDRMEFSTSISTGRERLFTAEELMRLPDDEQILHIAGVGFIHCRKIRQNEIAPYCFDLADNPLEGGRLIPDPKVTLPTEFGEVDI